MNLLVFKSHCPILSTKSPVDRVPVREFCWATELVTRYYGTSLQSADDIIPTHIDYTFYPLESAYSERSPPVSPSDILGFFTKA